MAEPVDTLAAAIFAADDGITLDQARKMMFEHGQTEHCGDCVKEAHTCPLCCAENGRETARFVLAALQEAGFEVMSENAKDVRKVLAQALRATGYANAYADHCFAALDAAGFVVVPKEPTPEMLLRGEAANCFAMGCSECSSATECYVSNYGETVRRHEAVRGDAVRRMRATWEAMLAAADKP